jgi:hypothetical protein
VHQLHRVDQKAWHRQDRIEAGNRPLFLFLREKKRNRAGGTCRAVLSEIGRGEPISTVSITKSTGMTKGNFTGKFHCAGGTTLQSNSLTQSGDS